MKKFQSFVFLIILSVVISPVFADVTLPNIITSNMILQRNSPVPIWGRANAGEEEKADICDRAFWTYKALWAGKNP